ncbi:MAG: AMP-binding protein [Rhodovibrionaceae bacterium]|nr:AMP-binding protein [Rhodovibrionaceae bacterium]
MAGTTRGPKSTTASAVGAWSFSQLIANLEGRGERPAILQVTPEDVETWTARDLAVAGKRLAGGLAAAGLESGEPVALYAPNRPEWVVVALGVMAGGGVLLPIDDLADAAEAEKLLSRVRPKRIVTVRAHLDDLGQIEDGAPSEVYLLDADNGDEEDRGGGKSWRALLADEPADLPELDAERPCARLATSGTTGPPKIFDLTEANIAANVTAIVGEDIVHDGDRALLPLPLHHAYPLVVGTLTPLTAGTAMVLPEAASGPQILHALNAARVSVIVGVPRLYDALVTGMESKVAQAGGPARRAFTALLGLSAWSQERLGLPLGKWLFAPLRRRMGPDVRLLVSGGAHLAAPLQRRLEALGWLVLSGYGLAETASVFTANRPRNRRLGSAGYPLGDGEIRIAEPDDDAVGQVQLRGSCITPGYRDNPEANEAAFSADGWFRTGDLGRVDAQGFLFISGRKTEMIVLPGGKKVHPEELEKIYQRAGTVEEVAVLERGDQLVGLVRHDVKAVSEGGSFHVEQAVRAELGEIMRDLPSHYRLAGLAVTRESFPRTRLGKYRRFLLEEIYDRVKAGGKRESAPELSAEDRRLLEEPLAAKIWRILKEQFPGEPFDLDSSLSLDLGLDSFGWMNLTLSVEQHCEVALEPEEIAEIDTPRALIEAVREKAEKGKAAKPRRAAYDVDKWLRPPGPLLRAAGACLYRLNRWIMGGWFRLSVEGQEHLPAEGPYVIAVNHVSDLDPLVVGGALPYQVMQQVYWSGEVSRLFTNPLMRLVARIAHIFPVDERDPQAAVAAGGKVLERGGIQIWFPEAWRSPDGELQQFLPGIGRLLDERDVPVVPARISGAFEAMPRGQRWPRRHPIQIAFGQPARPQQLAEEGEGDSPADRIADGLRQRVAALETPAGSS